MYNDIKINCYFGGELVLLSYGKLVAGKLVVILVISLKSEGEMVSTSSKDFLQIESLQKKWLKKFGIGGVKLPISIDRFFNIYLWGNQIRNKKLFSEA